MRKTYSGASVLLSGLRGAIAATLLMLGVIAVESIALKRTVNAHGGGGGRGGGGRVGGYGGGNGRAGGYGGARGLDGGARGLDGGARGLDGGGTLDGRGVAEGGRAFDAGQMNDAGAGRFAGDANIARVANRGLDRGVRAYSIGGLNARGNSVRNNFYHGGWYGGRGWYGAHFGAWWPGGWWMGAGLLTGLGWAEVASWGGYGPAALPYNYGSTVCYQDDGVYVQGNRVGSADDYAEQAGAIASQGSADAKIADDDQWRSLGVFAVARSEDASPSTFMSLAIDRAGLLRGTYYDAVSDTSMNITGKVDKKTQRAAWIVGDKKTIVYEAGLHNLTQQQTTILVHRSTDARRAKSPDGSIAAGDTAASTVEQLLLVRVEDDAAAGSGQKADSTQAASPKTQTPIAEDSGK